MDQGKTLLIVDDEVDVCVLLSKFLKRRYRHIEYAHSLEDALRKASMLHPDLILLDNNLPDGYGIERISDFKSTDTACRLIVISAMSNLQQEALAAGADLFLEKPILLNSLLEVA